MGRTFDNKDFRMTDSVRQFTVGYDDDGIRLDRWFKRHMPDTSFTTVAKWARTGQLRVDGLRATPGDRIAAGQVLRVPPPSPRWPRAASRRCARAISCLRMRSRSRARW
ncbi:hypothetical protein GCM10020258_05850 [Sphingomonas yabuuchiae]